MNDLIKKKEKYILSIPDTIDLVEASESVAAWFIRSKKTKPEYQLENYICFHKDLRYAIYMHDDKFFFVDIMRPKKFLGFESALNVMVVTEILTDDLNDSHLEKGSIAGAALLRRNTDSEKNFFKAITSYDDVAAAEQAVDLQNQIKEEKELKAKEEERKAKEEEEDAKRKAKEEEEDAKRKAEEEEKEIETLIKMHGEDVIKAYHSGEVAIGMPYYLVEEILGFGHDSKKKASKLGETLKSKYGEYYKTLSNGERSNTASYKMEVEYERSNSNDIWIVSA